MQHMNEISDQSTLQSGGGVGEGVGTPLIASYGEAPPCIKRVSFSG